MVAKSLQILNQLFELWQWNANHSPSCKDQAILQPGTEQVQALADISCSALCCHSNETCALIANPPNSTQLQGIPYRSHKLHPGPCSSVGMRQGTDRQTHIQPWPLYISPRLHLTQNVTSTCSDHIDYTISRYWSRIRRAYDIVAAIYRTISVQYRARTHVSRVRCSHTQRRRLCLIAVACRAHRPWRLLSHVPCGRPIMQRIGSLGWGLGDGSCSSGGLNYACRKAHCARRTA